MMARTLKLRRLMAVVAACSSSLLAWSACVGDDPATSSGSGAQGQACFANGTCLVGLECRGGTCQVTDAGTDASSSLQPGADAREETRPDVVVDGCATAYRNAILADNPYAYWRMNTATGVTIADETSHRNDLTLSGGGFTLGAKGALACDPDPAIRFDGNQAHAFASDPFSRAVDFGAKEPFTIEVWVQREDTDADVSFHHVFDNKYGSNPKLGYLFYFNKPANGMSLEYDWPDGGVLISAPSRLDEWVYYATTFDSEKLSLYADGALTDDATGVQAMGARTVPFVLAREDGVANHNFVGALDEVAIYTRALSPQEVAHHYQVAKGK